MTWRDKLELGLKEDAAHRKDNLPPSEVRGPEIPNGPGRSPEIPMSRAEEPAPPSANADPPPGEGDDHGVNDGTPRSDHTGH